MVALAPLLPSSLLGEALASVRSIGDGGRRAEAMVALAPLLPSSLLGEALASVRSIGDGGRRAEAMVALAPSCRPQSGTAFYARP